MRQISIRQWFLDFEMLQRLILLNKKRNVEIVSTFLRRMSLSNVESDFLSNINPSFPPGWSKPDNNLLYYRPQDCTRFRSNKAVLFDVDGTIIKTKSGKSFPLSYADWIMWHTEVKPKLSTLYDNGTRIIFITNQKGIWTGQVDEEKFKIKMKHLLNEIEMDIEIFVCAGPGRFRKPAPGVYYLLLEFLDLKCKGNILMVGDAAGRPANKLAKKKVIFLSKVIFLNA